MTQQQSDAMWELWKGLTEAQKREVMRRYYEATGNRGMALRMAQGDKVMPCDEYGARQWLVNAD